MLYYFSRLFYGMILDPKDTSFVKQIFEEGKNIYTQEQFGMDIDMNYDFGSDTKFFIYILPSLQKINDNGIKEIEIKRESVLWNNILYNFCDLYGIKYQQPQWYLTNEVWS